MQSLEDLNAFYISKYYSILINSPIRRKLYSIRTKSIRLGFNLKSVIHDQHYGTRVHVADMVT